MSHPEPDPLREGLFGALWYWFKGSFWKPMIGVTIYTEDSPHLERYKVEDELMKVLEDCAEWIGAGAGDVGQGPFFDIAFESRRPKEAVAKLVAKLREMRAGPRTEIQWKKNKLVLGQVGSEEYSAPNP